jgi:hypothetical protein
MKMKRVLVSFEDIEDDSDGEEGRARRVVLGEVVLRKNQI